MKKARLTKIITAMSVIILISAISIELIAYPGGISGRTRKTSTSGCSSCHSSSASINGVITGPTTVVAGQSYTFTLTINMLSGSGREGVDIAVKNGTLSVGSSGLQLMSGELTHVSPGITYVNPKVIQFGYTAPATPGTDTIYATVDRGYSGAWAFAANYGFTVTTASGVIGNETQLTFGLSQNFPNPFNPATQINYSLDKKGLVTLKVFDVAGKEVADLVNEIQNEGAYTISFNGENIPSGIYYYKLTSNGNTEVKKMMLVK
jgi:hypothetical protein